MTVPVRRICALVAYDGTDFGGFQVQEHGPTVQGTLEEALTRLTGAFCRVAGAGRTDAGVHARGQVVMVDVPWRHSLEALCRAWNHHVPETILVRRVVPAPEAFHPRFSATARTYRYTVYASRTGAEGCARRFPLFDRYALVEPRRLDVAAMNRAARLLVGEHDFATFGQPPQGDVTVRRVEAMEWQPVEDNLPELEVAPLRRLVFTVTANAFLRRMVRNLVGTLLAVGRGEWRVDDVGAALEARDRSRSAPPVPPNGLVLERIEYADYPHLFV